MALKKVEKWFAVNEFTYNTHHFFRGQEIKGLTQEEMTGLNDLIYKKEVEIDVDNVVEESTVLTSNTEVKEEIKTNKKEGKK